MAGNSTDPGRSVTSKVTAILVAFTDGAALTLTEIAGIAKLPTSTAHRLAAELVAWRLLERTEEGGYRVGLPLRILVKDATEFDPLNRAILIARARPLLAELARNTSTDARLGILKGHMIAVVGQSPVSGNGAAALTLPAHTTAIGRALLAFSPSTVIDEVIAAARWSPGATAPDHLRQALSIIRQTKIATARDESPSGRCAIAMPVFSGGGRVAAAIELTLPDRGPDCTLRDRGSDITVAAGALTVACRSLSRQLATELRDHGAGRGEGSASAPSA